MAPPPLGRVLLFVVSVFSAASAAVPGCATYRCGNGGIITYPFWHQDGPANNYCGYQFMGLACKGGYPRLLTEFNNYKVTKIDTSNRTITLVDAVVETENPYCPWVRQNLTFDDDRQGVFGYAPSTSNVTFFFNCTRRLSTIASIPCLNEVGNFTSYVVRDWMAADKAEEKNLTGSCQKIVTAPVDKRRVEQVFESRRNFGERFGSALQRGFQLQWKKPDNKLCNECEGSGGSCGLSDGHIVCYCVDGVHRKGSCNHGKKTRSKTKTIILAVIFVSFALLCASLFCRFFTSKGKKCKGPKKEVEEEELKQEGENLSFFEFELLATATGNFCDSNKIGKGGFGTVYKGKLRNGLDIAIKRLSQISNQGLEELKSEVTVIAKLRHRNLVRLLGCCLQGKEKILIYEFLPNGSLDSILFSNEKKMILNWKKRFNIIKGIARGLLYLHEDSRLKIIHRDLKAGNILLDMDMNPKISDFGMARIFGGNQDEANTGRVVGTYGYMSPEYALRGHFSTKSDVYSYGVLVLEILSGKKITSFYTESFETLLSFAWQLWEEKLQLELVDSVMVGRCEMGKVLRCMHIALLCVQDNVVARPTMSSVVHMLEDTLIPLDCQPKRPTFTDMVDKDANDQNMGVDISQSSSSSINDASIMIMKER